jgi:hypothetical protein
MQIVKYETEQEAQQIIQEKEALGFVLIEVSNITEGNFLGFTEPQSLIKRTTLDEVIEQNLVLMDALATIFEAITGGQ